MPVIDQGGPVAVAVGREKAAELRRVLYAEGGSSLIKCIQ
jgi:hypothetical protein